MVLRVNSTGVDLTGVDSAEMDLTGVDSTDLNSTEVVSTGGDLTGLDSQAGDFEGERIERLGSGDESSSTFPSSLSNTGEVGGFGFLGFGGGGSDFIFLSGDGREKGGVWRSVVGIGGDASGMRVVGKTGGF